MNLKRENYKLKKILRDLLDSRLHLEIWEQRQIIFRACQQKKKSAPKTNLIQRKTGKVLGFKKEEAIYIPDMRERYYD